MGCALLTFDAEVVVFFNGVVARQCRIRQRGDGHVLDKLSAGPRDIFRVEDLMNERRDARLFLLIPKSVAVRILAENHRRLGKCYFHCSGSVCGVRLLLLYRTRLILCRVQDKSCSTRSRGAVASGLVLHWLEYLARASWSWAPVCAAAAVEVLD